MAETYSKVQDVLDVLTPEQSRDAATQTMYEGNTSLTGVSATQGKYEVNIAGNPFGNSQGVALQVDKGDTLGQPVNILERHELRADRKVRQNNEAHAQKMHTLEEVQAKQLQLQKAAQNQLLPKPGAVAKLDPNKTLKK